jgi:HSP20 family protein
MATKRSFMSPFDRMFTPPRESDRKGHNGDAAHWVPVVDIVETASAYVIAAELPGVAPEAVEISITNNLLTLRGVKTPTLHVALGEADGETTTHTTERVVGAFARELRLPDYVESDRAEASFADGVLTISVPKVSSRVSRKIAIKKN